MSKNYSICVLAPDLIPVWSGIGSYMVGLLKNLPKSIEAHVLTTRRKVPSGQRKIEVKDEYVLREFKDNVKIHFVSSAEDTFLYHLKFQLACFRVVPKLFKEEGFALLHSNFPLMSDVILQLAKQVRVPTVTTIHTTIEGQHEAVKAALKNVAKLEQSDKANLYLYLPLKACELLYLRNRLRFIATSYFIKREITHFFPFLKGRDIPVIHYGIDTRFFSPQKPKNPVLQELYSLERPIVLFTGRFVLSKGMHTLIEAIPDVVSEFPDVLFVFVGGGDYAPYVEKLKSKGVPENYYRFLGYMQYFEMPQVYSLASIYVMPTLYESFPLRMLESMSCQRAVIATNVCGIPEIIRSGYNGILVPPQNSKALKEKLIMLLEDEKLRQKIGENARKTILNGFSVEIMTSKTLKVYEETLQSP